jgi:uncharacterized protein with FMN-binding domain
MKRQFAAAGVLVAAVGLSVTISGCAGSPAAGSLTAAGKEHTITHPQSAAPTPTVTVTPTAMPSRRASPSTAKKPTPPRTTTHASTPVTHKPKPKPKPKPPAAIHYRDGSYTANGSYTSPGGTETIRVTIALGNDIVTAVSVSTVSADPTATGYEAQFASGISGAAVGRNIGTLHVGAVAGSSLTANGFNRAVLTIRANAKE